MSLRDHLETRERTRTGALPPVSAVPALADTLDAALTDLGSALPEGAVLLAVGGTGRRRLTAHTDIDVAIVSRRRLRPEAVRPVLLPLWDADLRVGHSVRTLDEVGAAVSDPTVACSLLTRRVLAGDDDVADRLVRVLRRRIDVGGLRRHLLDEERSRRLADPYGSAFPDLKRGRGGLRTLDLLGWLAALESADRSAPATEGRQRLPAVRVALHAAAAGNHDVLAAELVSPTATRLGLEPRALMAAVLGEMDAAEHTLTDVVPGLARLRPPTTERPAQHPTDAGLGDAVESARFADRRPTGGPPPAWTAADRSALRWLLGDTAGREVMEDLRRSGWLKTAVPELDRTWLEPHLVPFHRHPVGGHSLRVLDELRRDPRWESLPATDREVLEWAALFHDIGKGAGDHAEVGARRFEAAAARIRMPADLSTRVRRIVRLHLLLADVATRHDVQDRAVVAAAASSIGDESMLDLLAIFTGADSRATGTDTWTAWRRSLIDAAVEAVRAAIAGRTRGGPVVDHLVRTTGLEPAAVLRHLSGLPDTYRIETPVDLIARHLRAVEAGGTVVHVDAGRDATEVVVVAPDRPRLLADITGALTAVRCSIVASRCLSRSDGTAIDTFTVVDWLTGGPPTVDIAQEVLRFLDAPSSIEAAVGAKTTAYRTASGVAPDVEVVAGAAVEVTVRCGDRLGLVHDIAAAVADAGGTVSAAHLDTFGGFATDRFVLEGLDPETARRVVLEAVTSPS